MAPYWSRRGNKLVPKGWVYRMLGRELLREDLADDLAAPHILEGMSCVSSLRAATQGQGAR